MTEAKILTTSELAARVGGRVIGDGNVAIQSVAALETANEGEIAYVDDEKFFDAASKSRASCLIVPLGAAIDSPCGVTQPKLAFALIAEVLHPPNRLEPSIHQTAVIAEGADVALTAFIGPHVCIGEHSRVGVGAQIHAGVSIGDHVAIGSDCVIHPNVVIYDNVTIGNRVILHAESLWPARTSFYYVRCKPLIS